MTKIHTKKPNIKEIFGLITWQLSLLVVFVVFLIISGVIVIVSPDARNAISNAPNLTVEPTPAIKLAEKVRINFNIDLLEVDLKIYNQFDGKQVPYEFYNENFKSIVELYPGAYKFVFKKTGFKTIEQEVILNIEDKTKDINVEFVIDPVVEENIEIIDGNDLSVQNLNIFDKLSGDKAISVRADQSYFFSANLVNHSKFSIEDIDISWQIVGDSPLTNSTSHVTSVESGKSVEIFSDWINPKIGEYKLILKIDSSDSAKELDEKNNTIEINIKVI